MSPTLPPGRMRAAGGRKPGSVPLRSRPRHGDDHSSGSPVARHLKRSTRGLGPAALQPAEAGVRPRLDLAPGGVYRGRRHRRPPCALTARFHPCAARRRPRTDVQGRGLLSVALSLRLPSPAVSRHPAVWSPDFPPAFASGHLTTRDSRENDTTAHGRGQWGPTGALPPACSHRCATCSQRIGRNRTY